ncbi:MAG: Fumarate reductase flavoprotein subunit [Rhodothermaeota bacterium MED-G12]|nr:MAG: Fumarate reductase flavoprotein subunit [Rhodothermaeota bacterium MED-G12]|tara:strand:- start:586 stop:2511 length:1926 start_codon:yes stop_codon:yes gene_type:complete
MISLDAKIPEGPLEQKWSRHKKEMKLVAPNNRRKYEVIIVGTGLAGGAAAASMAEMGYKVKSFCIQDSARRAHSIAAQGGINAAKNYPNDGDSVWRLFYDTIKGGDYRSREANVYRLAEVSNSIIDQAVAQGVPFAREYSGLLANRSFGGAQVSRTFYARGQTGQQLLLGAYQAMMRQVELGGIEYYTRHEMLEVVIIDGKARGIITRDLVTGEICRHEADAVILATGGYGNVFYLSTNAKNSNVTAAWRAHKKGALFANPSFVQVHPTCIPVSGDYQSKLTLMSESLRNDGRVWVSRKKGDDRHPNDIPEDERFYYLEEKYPSFGNLVPRDVASRNAKVVCDQGLGAGKTGLAVYLDFRDAIARDGKDVIAAKYGNLFDMYANIAGEDPYSQPMRIFPAVHYTMGGLWVDYNLMTNIPGLFAAGEANFSDHGANRLGASALMQGLSDGYFVLPSTIGNYLADVQPGTRYGTDHEAFETAAKQAQDSIDRLLNINGKRTIIDFYRTLGRIVWDKIGISRTKEGLEEAIADIRSLRDEFWTNVYVPGEKNNYNKYLEFAGRVADFFELAELMAMDALDRDESCGCHLREEFQTEEGEAIRNDEEFNYVSAWEFKDRNGVLEEELHKEVLNFEFVELKQRSYK